MIGSLLRIRYEVLAQLFDGPFFTTYTARDRVQGRDVCVKVFKEPFASQPDFVEAYSRFAAAASAVDHPGIEKVYGLDDHEGTPFLVTELPRGSVLRERLRRFAPFSVPVCVATALAICEPLYALNKAGIVHGDISADDVVMGTDGTALLLQGGVWQAYPLSPSAGMVALPGMASYLAPEVSAGAMPSPQSDVYAVGVLLYELLTAHAPYRAETPVALAMKHATGVAPRVRALNGSVPMVLDEIVHKALNKDPEQRYASIGDLISDLRYLQDALRFGRSLNWPIRPETLSRPQPVAPKMSAVRVEPKAEPRGKPAAYVEEPSGGGDVPAWMRVAVTFVVAMLVFFTGWWVVTSLSTTKDVKVPKIIGQTVSEATSVLNASGLKMVVSKKEPSETYPAETIIDVEPPAGQTVKQTGTVFVVVSSGSKFVELPDLRSMTVDEARSLLGKLNLRLDPQIVEARSSSVPKGQIIEQRPEARTQVEQNRSVSVKVSSGEAPPDTTPTPDANLDYRYTVRVKVTHVTDAVTLRVDMIDDRGTQTVYEQEQYPDDVVEVQADGVGAKVVFRIYYDGVFKKEVPMTPKEGEPAR